MLKFGLQFLCQKFSSKGSARNNMKGIHTSKFLTINENLVKEIKIPFAWGHIAAKWWGNPTAQPVLALHGVQDNAATFETLVPLLDVEAVLAVDIPGHGWSSHIPIGFSYNFMEGIGVLRYLIKHHFKWSKPMILLGHSFGSSLNFVYAALYPNEVSKYISIDCSRHHASDNNRSRMIPSMKNTIEKLLKFEEVSKPPEYNEDELLEVFFKGRKGPKGWITKEACKHLLSRGTRRLPNGKVYLSRDPRLRLDAFDRLTPYMWIEFAERINCDVLSIQAESGIVKDNSKGELYKKTVQIILKNSPKSKHIILPGNHHMHIDNPEPVANEINKFLSS